MRRYLFYSAIGLVAFAIGIYCAVDYYWNVSEPDISASEIEPITHIPEQEPITVDVTALRPANPEEIAKIDAIKARELWEIERVPQGFRPFDFKNFTYDSILGNGKFRLKNGEFKKEVKSGDKYGDTTELWRASFKAVEYQDFNNDGSIDALVELGESQTAGSTYAAYAYKLFTLRNGNLSLIWQTATGSESGCGHKQLSIENHKIILEVFGICKRSSGPNQDKDASSDIYANWYTQFVYGWDGQKFAPESRNVFPYAEHDVYKYLYKNTLPDFIDRQYYGTKLP